MVCWFVHPNLETDDVVGYYTHTNLIRDQYSSPKKTLKLLHLHHFRDFAGLFFSPVWWLSGLFFGSFDELCSHARRHPLGGCESHARFDAGGFSPGKFPANSGVWAKAG